MTRHRSSPSTPLVSPPSSPPITRPQPQKRRSKKPNRSVEGLERRRARDRARAQSPERKAQVAAAAARYYEKNRRIDAPRRKPGGIEDTRPVREEIIIGEGGHVVEVREVRERATKAQAATGSLAAIPGSWRLEIRETLSARRCELGRQLTAAEVRDIREDILTRYNAAAGWPVKLRLR